MQTGAVPVKPPSQLFLKNSRALRNQTGFRSFAHDAVEFPDGRIMLLTLLCEGQSATVLQLPARPKTVEEAKDQERAAYAG
jgi:hypothetical protein